jgi:hypothetical protein
MKKLYERSGRLPAKNQIDVWKCSDAEVAKEHQVAMCLMLFLRDRKEIEGK